jgi:hypothetical protein
VIRKYIKSKRSTVCYQARATTFDKKYGALVVAWPSGIVSAYGVMGREIEPGQGIGW